LHTFIAEPFRWCQNVLIHPNGVTMSAKVFLSLSYINRDFVAEVRARLPTGLAYFYEESFENGELLLSAMERAVKDAAVFVLFASKRGQSSPWVAFEIAQARLQQIQTLHHRILVFPTDPDVKLADLPQWLRDHWIPQAGLSPADIARYITTVLLEPNLGLSAGAVRVIGRGKTLDRLEQIAADHIARTHLSPTVYLLSGFRGIGRRTFASYYMRNALSANANMPFGPALPLSPQADLADIHQALRTEISPTMHTDAALRERLAFQELSATEQINEIVRLISHFSQLGQAVTIISAGGFFEERGDPKEWFIPLLIAIPKSATLFVVSNRQIRPELLQGSANVVQMRVDELHDKDIRALMIFTAERLRVENFSISDELVRAIGGHADVANAAVRLAAVKGVHILERDPRQLFNIQNTILGESIEGDALTDSQRQILCLLSWVPALNGNLLERILIKSGVSNDDVLAALENLVLGCLVISSGPNFSISPSIRLLFRRFNVTPPELLRTFSAELFAEWRAAERQGQFRTDLFEAFVFMHSLEGKTLPRELLPLLTPGMLHDVIRNTYARGKDEADIETLERVILWGQIAEQMKMSEATREEILSTIARAQIRLGKFPDAEETINNMGSRRYRSVPFLLGHLYRRQEKYHKAVEMLVEAIRLNKFNRSAVHELALAYKKSGRLTAVGVSVSFFFPDTGNSKLVCRRSAAALRFGFVSAAASCARLRLSALIKSSTGAGGEICLGVTGRPFIFASISSRSAS
jgi:tetratricopeptide (TPR) repeat protein